MKGCFLVTNGTKIKNYVVLKAIILGKQHVLLSSWFDLF